MSQKTTAQQKAEERYPYRSDQWEHLEMMEQNRDAFIACYTEQVEPRDRMMQELVRYAEHAPECSKGKMDGVNYDLRRVWVCDCGLDALLSKAKEQFGITPTQP